jgi:DNA (cytosine-5)-methyltransferase 1
MQSPLKTNERDIANTIAHMESKTREELIALCKEQGIKGYSGKKKEDVVKLLIHHETSSHKLGVLSLFSGCGGLDYGFHNNPVFEVKRSYDSMKHAVDTYNMNFSTKAEQMDVKELLNTDFELGFSPDVIIGGPPCQDFSIAGQKTLGDRANLTEIYIDIVCKYRPLYFIMENVPTIRTIGKTVYDSVLKKLKDAHYGLSINTVYMPDYGIPQERKRLIMIGKRDAPNDIFNHQLNDTKTPINSIREFIMKTGVDLGLNNKEHIYRHPRNYSRRGVYSIDELYPTVRGCLRKMPPNYKFHDKDTTKSRDEIASPDWNMVARIQTFPPSFKFANKNNALIIGNAVPPRFSEVLSTIISTHHTSS